MLEFENPRKGRFLAMQASCEIRETTREKLAELRRKVRNLKPETRGSENQRRAAAVKGYGTWADTRERAIKKGTR